jgi:hypothetical protein
MVSISSIRQIVNGISKLVVTSLRVSCGRVQILVAKNLSQPNQIVPIVFQIFVSHRVPKQMRVNLHADDRSELVTQSSNTTVAQRPPFPDEDSRAFNRRATLKIRLQSTPGWKR